MSNLRAQVIKLAQQKPELRPHLQRVLASSDLTQDQKRILDRWRKTNSYAFKDYRDLPEDLINDLEDAGDGHISPREVHDYLNNYRTGRTGRTAQTWTAAIKTWDSGFTDTAVAGDRRYQYVPFHKLTPVGQNQARGQYPHKSVGAAYDFLDEHYLYPVKQDGSLASARRNLAIPLAKIKNRQYMEGLGYTLNPGWEGRVASDNRWERSIAASCMPRQAGCEKLPEGGMRDNCEKKVEDGKGKTAANTDWLDDVLKDLSKDYTSTRSAFKPVNYARVNGKPITDIMIKGLKDAIQEDLQEIKENGYATNGHKAGRALFDKIQAWSKTLKPSKTASTRQAGYSFAEDTAWFAFVGNKTPFNVDVIEKINYTAITFRDDDGKVQEDLGMRVNQPISYSPSLTRGLEMAGAVREVVFAVKYPRGALRQVQAALTAIGKALKFQVEYLPSPRKAQTRQKAR